MSDNKENGFVCLYRSMLNWEWYDDIVVTKLFIHLLLRANHTEKQWNGITVPRGSLLTRYSSLSAESGLTVKQVRDGISKLIRTNEVAKSSTPKYSLITLNNYDKYQIGANKRAGKWSHRGQTEGKQRATNNNDKNDNNEKNISAVAQDEKDVRIFPPGGDF